MTPTDLAPATLRRLFRTRGGRNLSFTALGFGSAPLGNYTRPLAEEEADGILAAAWRSGIRYYDTAPFYGLGLSEQRVGRLLQAHPRQEFTLSTKVGRLLDPCAPEEVNGGFFVQTPQVKWYYDYSYDAVMRSLEDSRRRTGIARFDIVLVHDVDAFCHGGREGSEAAIQQLLQKGGWRALQELREAGVIGAIGAGVNEWEPCARLLELVDPDLFLVAGRYTLLEHAPLDHLFPQCQRRGAGIIVGGPYNSGILAGKATYNYSTVPAEVLARVRRLEAVCKAHAVPMHAAALQFVLAHPVIVSVIPGSQSIAEHRQNFAALSVDIPAAFWDELRRERLIPEHAPVPA
ncbi:MAG: aldo/keto reductase [Steroidobacteraceae bacterium]